ncbi:D-serine ammonia-lyase [Mobilicoccus pelagius]|uniref:Probable D-serine dehydratase n=1 Tax=Mobilicoccus pelagius NBRC 104925 TaxID=1089455 RepID=H5UND2_9MICO|nr:D-serine ammonia-lyase [Mobilicoccus pelagius]GAB47240.1 D-serine dehydratase [Mobilicoccus pelagius NBRC 104925]
MTRDLLADVRLGVPTVWTPPSRDDAAPPAPSLALADVHAADARLRRFAPFLAGAFDGPWYDGPRGVEEGVIDSPLTPIPAMRDALGLPHDLWLKRDDALPVSGSIKARGGIYEVLALAERIALESGWAGGDPERGDHRDFAGSELRDLLSGYTVAVGSTGNLGLSIGVMARTLGFRAVIHMSADARAWKKDMLRGLGAEVVEYGGDYGLAVATGRAQAEKDPRTHFVDDETSRELFLGYAVAGLRLVDQLEAADLLPSAAHPLHVHLPCGVGGGPGGIVHGLHLALRERGLDTTHLHCWYAEPVQAPCMLLALATGRGDDVDVQEFGLDGATLADGLAVGRASRLAWSATKNRVAGAYTVRDADLMDLLRRLDATEGLRLEPSALAGVAGPTALHEAGIDVGDARSPRSRHLAWATGGSLVPAAEMETYLRG